MVAALQAHATKSGSDADKVWALITKDKNAKQDTFDKFLDRLPELSGKDDVCFTAEQKTSVFAAVGGKKGKLNQVDFKMLFRVRFVCTESTPAMDQLDGGKALTSVEVGDGRALCRRQSVQPPGARVAAGCGEEGAAAVAACYAGGIDGEADSRYDGHAPARPGHLARGCGDGEVAQALQHHALRHGWECSQIGRASCRERV